MKDVFAVQAVMNLIDNITGPLRKIGAKMKGTGTDADKLGGKMAGLTKKMLPVAIAAGIVVGGFAACVGATIETQSALGELASVGITDMDALSSAAADFSNQWAGTTKPEFIAAAYDIKSGISTLTDPGVAEFAKLAAMTGKATKSSTAEMTSLFATGYGIYKGMYSELTDMEFGQVFSAGISASVQNFKTTGSGMAQAISSLGATATTAKIPLEEQLSVLGMLQATMSGSEAGTKYKALMQSAAGAGQKLGLQFMDSNNQLLSLPQILNTLKSEYGGTLDAMEKMEIQKAFGTQEAVAVIDLLYGKVGDLTGNIESMAGTMGMGTEFTKKMAGTMNNDLGAVMQLNAQKWHNLKEIIGNVFLPVITPLMSGLGKVITLLQQLASTKVGRVLIITAAVIAGVVLVVTAFAAAISAVSFILPILAGALIPVIAAVWSFTIALLACPLTWIVIAVVAVGAALYYLYNRFEIVRFVIDKLLFVLGYSIGIYVRVGKALFHAFMHPMDAIKKLDSFVKGIIPRMAGFLTGSSGIFKKAGKALWGAFVWGIKAQVMAPVKVVKFGLQKLRDMLPFSDAKEGPLSTLTLSGSKIMETMAAGVKAAAPVLQGAASVALAGITAVMPVNHVSLPGASMAQAAVPESVKTIEQHRSSETISSIENYKTSESITDIKHQVKNDSGKQSGKSAPSGKTIIIQNMAITLPSVKNADDFTKELQRFVEQYDV